MGCKLLVIGGDPASFAPAFASGAELVCLDLEDTVPAAAKSGLRALVPEFLAQGRTAGCTVGLRISPLSTRDCIDDLQMLYGLTAPPDQLILTKVESAAEVGLLARLTAAPDGGGPALQAIIETAEGLRQAEAIATAGPRLTSLAFGGKDLSMALRAERTWEPLLHARARVAHAAALAGIGAYDEPYHPRDDLVGLQALCLRVRAMGYTGKTATDPRHAAVINEVFRMVERKL